MRFSFPDLDTISPYLFGREDYDLRDPEVNKTVRDLTLSNPSFYFRAILGTDFAQSFHYDWFNFQLQHPLTLLLAPRGALKCIHPTTLVPCEDGVVYAKDLERFSRISSVFKSFDSRINNYGESVQTGQVIRVKIKEPLDFWIYVSPEHKFFCFDKVRNQYDLIEASRLSPSSHYVLISRPPSFKPRKHFHPNIDVVRNSFFTRQQLIPKWALNLSPGSFHYVISLVEKCFSNEELKEAFPFLYNSLQVLKFFYGTDKLGSREVIDDIKMGLQGSDLDLEKISFLVDLESDFVPSVLQTNSNLSCFARIESIDRVNVIEPISFVDFETTTSHYIANGFVTHNSTFCTSGACLYFALRNPEKRFSIISASGKLSGGHLLKIKRLCEQNPVIRYCFNDIINPRQIVRWSSDALEFVRKSIFPEPTICALSVGTDFTGSHFDDVFFDDLVTIKHRKSLTLRSQVWDWFRLTALPALERNIGTGHVVGTRYHWDDMYGKLYQIAEASGTWKVLRTPALDEALLAEGIAKSFWPEKFPEEELLTIRNDYGEESFQLQYQCAAGYLLGSKSHLNRIKECILPITDLEKLFDLTVGVDLASKGGSAGNILPEHKKSSYSITAIGRHVDTGKFVVAESYSTKRPTLKEQREWVSIFNDKYNPLTIAVEEQAYQVVFIEYLEELENPLPVRPYKCNEGKDARFDYITGLVAAGSLFFLEGMCQSLIEELYTYPDCLGDAIDSCYFALRNSHKEPKLRFL